MQRLFLIVPIHSSNTFRSLIWYPFHSVTFVTIYYRYIVWGILLLMILFVKLRKKLIIIFKGLMMKHENAAANWNCKPHLLVSDKTAKKDT